MRLVRPSYTIVTPNVGDEMLQRIECAGRTCYKSEDKATPDSAREFCRKVIKRGHHSVIEHESISVRFVIDRGVSHELVRHRLCAFSQESTRFCDYVGGIQFVIPVWMPNVKAGEFNLELDNDSPAWFMCMGIAAPLTDAEMCWVSACNEAEANYKKLRAMGWTPQQARSVLPNSLKAEIVITANLREWRHIFSLRCVKTAHPQMREIMVPLLEELRQLIPVIFEDLPSFE